MHDCIGTELHFSCSQHSSDNSPAIGCALTEINKANVFAFPKMFCDTSEGFCV